MWGLIPAAIGVLGSLFGKKGGAVQQLPSIMQTQQGKDIINYLMSMYKQPAAGQYGSNMGMYTLMNKFYPGQMNMPTQQSQSNPYAALLGGGGANPNQARQSGLNL